MSEPLFTSKDAHLGDFSLQAFDLDRDTPLLHQWVNQPHAGFWGMQGQTPEQVRNTQAQLRREGVEIYLGSHAGQPQFMLELYRPHNTELKEHIALKNDDWGMHILIALPETVRHSGFTLAVFHCIMQFLFEHKGAGRVLVEPDVGNHKVHALNRKVGFHHFRQVHLCGEGKDALLGECSRDAYYRCRALADKPLPAARTTSDAHAWAQVNRQLVAKALSEFLHERLLEAQPLEEGLFAVSCGTSRYCFAAEQLPLEHWLIDADSLTRTEQGKPCALNLLEFFQSFQQPLGISDDLLPTYLEEIASTLNGQLWKYQHPVANSRELAHADLQTLEQAMTEGHPCFVANSGKIGFDTQDFLRYAPETGQPVQLLWTAVHRSRADFYCVEELDYARHLDQELDLSQQLVFNKNLNEQGLNPDDYWLMPVHPWQWHNQLQRLFAGEIAAQRIVYLGAGEDAYTAQQSIRTFFNRSRPQQSYVKVALSILNMGFMRGLSSKYMSVTPAINQWVADLFESDQTLRELPLKPLREYAAIGYRHPQYDQGLMQTSPYNKMLAALWRDNPLTQLKPGQEAMTMAGLLHVDRDGQALISELIKASGLNTHAWLGHYLKAYLTPLLHCFYQHKMVFMPHGENLILVMEKHTPVAAFIKDIGEEVALLNADYEVPERIQRIKVTVPEPVELLSVFTDIFDCFFRFLSGLLHRHQGFAPTDFWACVAQAVRDYQDAHPELAERFARYDMFQPEFELSCLNRLQLNNNKQMLDLLNPADSLQFAGTLSNPLAAFARRG